MSHPRFTSNGAPSGTGDAGPEAFMIRIFVLLACLCCAVAAPAAAFPLSNFPSELSVLDPGGVLSRVDVYTTGREPYDSYFLRVAMVHGTMAMAEALTSQFGQALGVAAGKDAGSDPTQWPEMLKALPDDASADQLAVLKERGHRLEQLIVPVMKAVEEAPALAAQGPGLVASAPHDFTGLRGRVKLVGVMNALRRSGGQLGGAGVNLKRTLDNLRTIVAALPR